MTIEVGAPPLASYGRRAAAYLLDGLISLVLSGPGLYLMVAAFTGAVGEPRPGLPGIGQKGFITGLYLIIAGTLLNWYNRGWRQGVTGRSWGKQLLGLRLVSETSGEPVGGPVGLGRELIRGGIGSATAGLYTLVSLLWPLGDRLKRTLDDRILGTVVVAERR
jgi:uncharacterized RDD family membrane protein YckC